MFVSSSTCRLVLLHYERESKYLRIKFNSSSSRKKRSASSLLHRSVSRLGLYAHVCGGPDCQLLLHARYLDASSQYKHSSILPQSQKCIANIVFNNFRNCVQQRHASWIEFMPLGRTQTQPGVKHCQLLSWEHFCLSRFPESRAHMYNGNSVTATLGLLIHAAGNFPHYPDKTDYITVSWGWLFKGFSSA